MENKLSMDLSNFDYETCLAEYRNSIKKPNILVCGGTGVGKSSLINSMFCFDVAEVGKTGMPQTRGVIRYDDPESNVVLYDSEGYEVGSQEGIKRYKRDIIGFIEAKQKEHPDRMEEHIHEVWYCINKRFTDMDAEIVATACNLLNRTKNENIPLMVVITKVDTMDESEVRDVRRAIKTRFPDISVFTFSTMISEEEYPQFVQRSGIIDWAINNLDVSLQLGLVPALKMSVANTRKTLLKTTIPAYTTMAVGAVLGISALNIPVADAAALVGLQTKMAMDILKSYNIGSQVKNILGGILGSQAVSYLGKTLATQIVGLIPGIGNAAKFAVNAPVAGAVTASLGAAITVVCEQYLKLCIDHNGDDFTPQFAEFFTKENLQKALELVKNDPEYQIKDIVDTSMERASKTDQEPFDF